MRAGLEKFVVELCGRHMAVIMRQVSDLALLLASLCAVQRAVLLLLQQLCVSDAVQVSSSVCFLFAALFRFTSPG